MFTKVECSACKKFKSVLRQYYLKEFEAMAKRFNMVSIEGPELSQSIINSKFRHLPFYFNVAEMLKATQSLPSLSHPFP